MDWVIRTVQDACVHPSARVPVPPLHRWGQLTEPAEVAGAYLFVELESNRGSRHSRRQTGVRVWQRRPGEPDVDGRNSNVPLQLRELVSWMAEKGYVVGEWFPEGVEPDWNHVPVRKNA